MALDTLINLKVRTTSAQNQKKRIFAGPTNKIMQNFNACKLQHKYSVAFWDLHIEW